MSDNERLPVLRETAQPPATEWVDPRLDWPVEARKLSDWLLELFGPGDLVCDLGPSWIIHHDKPATRRVYAQNFRTWCSYTMSRGSHPLTATPVLADTFARWLESDTSTTRSGKVRAPRTRAAIIASLVSFYRDERTHKALKVFNPDNTLGPFHKVKAPRIKNKSVVTKVLSNQEFIAVARTARDYSARSFALVMLLYTTGVRIGEALGTDVTDLDTDHLGNHRLAVREKGDNTPTSKWVPVETWEALHTYLAGRDQGALFITESGKRWSEQGASDHLRFLGSHAGLTVRLHPHMLRAQFATDQDRLGYSLTAIQEALGHQHPETTRRYIKLNQDPANVGGHVLARRVMAQITDDPAGLNNVHVQLEGGNRAVLERLVTAISALDGITVDPATDSKTRPQEALPGLFRLSLDIVFDDTSNRASLDDGRS